MKNVVDGAAAFLDGFARLLDRLAGLLQLVDRGVEQRFELLPHATATLGEIQTAEHAANDCTQECRDEDL